MDNLSDSSLTPGALTRTIEDTVDLSPTDPVAVKACKQLLDIGASILIPGIYGTIKGAIVLCGLPFEHRKASRADEFRTIVLERLVSMRTEYVRREEFLDIFSDCLRRCLDQPDGSRRNDLHQIFQRVVDAPVDHSVHKMFLRLADELPAASLRVLEGFNRTVPHPGGHLEDLLMESSGLRKDEVGGWIAFLSAQGLIQVEGGTPLDLRRFLTPMGRLFSEFRHE